MLSVARNELLFLMKQRRKDVSVFVVAVYAHLKLFLYRSQPLYYNALKAKTKTSMEDALMKLCHIRSGQRFSHASKSSQ